ncbi:unnamed protein product [Cylicocyclus nassatus]|uniref:Uncharacterized protein n=1 Tax=Cylicocyclus nassatus TaxID=53992 RepID=A0AA36M8S8_CYLNA|nr:unnamed protein product [Cylicocyclus nassatus]
MILASNLLLLLEFTGSNMLHKFLLFTVFCATAGNAMHHQGSIPGNGQPPMVGPGMGPGNGHGPNGHIGGPNWPMGGPNGGRGPDGPHMNGPGGPGFGPHGGARH